VRKSGSRAEKSGVGPQLGVAVVGSANVDLVAYVDELPRAGETVVGKSFELGFGGKGANQAVMCALLGATVHFIGCVGRDVFGEMTLENLKSFGIGVSYVDVTEASASGAAPVWVDASGENRIIVVPGANNLLSPEVVEDALDTIAADVVVCQLEVPGECVARALRRARSMGAVAILNPAPMREIDLDLLGLCTWLIPNESELEAIGKRLNLDTSRGVSELTQRIGSLLEVDMVATLGADGAAIFEHKDETFLSVLAPDARALDTTGAGDAFVGAFAYAIGLGAAPEDAARFGCACASDSVERRGTQTSFPRDERLAEFKLALGQQTAAGTGQDPLQDR
jgi:ribokinase